MNVRELIEILQTAGPEIPIQCRDMDGDLNPNVQVHVYEGVVNIEAVVEQIWIKDCKKNAIDVL